MKRIRMWEVEEYWDSSKENQSGPPFIETNSLTISKGEIYKDIREPSKAFTQWIIKHYPKSKIHFMEFLICSRNLNSPKRQFVVWACDIEDIYNHFKKSQINSDKLGELIEKYPYKTIYMECTEEI